MSGERTEKPSEQRKKKAQDEGQIVKSRELNASISMLGGVMLTHVAVVSFVQKWKESYVFFLATSTQNDLSDVGHVLHLAKGIFPIAFLVVIAFSGITIITFAVGAAQNRGVKFHAKALSIKFERINPVENVKQLFSMRALARLGKSLLPAAIILLLAISLISKMLLSWPVFALTRMTQMFSLSYSLALDTAWVMLGWSVIDYAMEWRSLNQRLRMTKQEVRDESRDGAANPQVKGKMRQIARAMARQKARADLSKASVLIMNPTHFAVALDFNLQTMEAPKVLAKGRDFLALQMRDEAQWAGVPIVVNPPLARSLYRSVPVGRSIPFDLYSAVAGVLAYLYRQQMEKAQREGQRGLKPIVAGGAR